MCVMSKMNRVGIRLVSPLLLLLVFISSAAPVAAEWERVVHDKRLPAELRVVNEGRRLPPPSHCMRSPPSLSSLTPIPNLNPI